MSASNPKLWEPGPDERKHSRMARFMASPCHQQQFTGYPQLHAWSLEEPEAFWSAVWDFFEVIGDKGTPPYLVNGGSMPGAKWFPAARLNYAENLLAGKDEQLAIIAYRESRERIALSRGALRESVAIIASHLRNLGVTPGDRVAALLPNAEQALVAMLATAAIGAVFSSCSPDFGEAGVLDRFGQIEPKVLIACNGYRYNGRDFDLRTRVKRIQNQIPGQPHLLGVNYLEEYPWAVSEIDSCWEALPRDRTEPLSFTPRAFDDPLFILFSSGTTGAPKCIVHTVGGTLLQHLKELGLHTDVRPGEKIFYYTTCGWMMWNWLASALALESTVVLYDGSPFWPDSSSLFQLAETEALQHFGASAKYYAACDKAEEKPALTRDLSALRALLSTGSPLAPETFDYLYRDVKADVRVSSISGGTDIISCFALGNPLLPVYRGELQAAGLGMDLLFMDDDGHPLREGKGELVCARPFPSMPCGFWNDPDGQKYLSAYFERYPGLWAHGDFGEFLPHGDSLPGVMIHGRSDAVLNPGGVRIGTAEIYRQVESLPEVQECLAIGQPAGNDERVVLFVVLRGDRVLSEQLKARICQHLREQASPRHVPAVIAQVPELPRTRSGKITELAVRQTVLGQPVKNKNALANPAALAHFQDHPALKD